MGMTMAEATPAPTEVWPDCWDVALVFAAVPNGAWTVGMNGPVGIRPECYPELRLACDVSTDKWRAMFDDFQVMEFAALNYMHTMMRKDSK